MYNRFRVNLGNLLLSLSDALDMCSPVLASHQQRTAFIAWQMGKMAELPEPRIENLFIAALLHDVGALSPEEKIRIHEFETDNPEEHCQRGKILLDYVKWMRPAARIVRNHHREWQDWSMPLDTPAVVESQILHLADHLERMIKRDAYILHQDEQITSSIISLSGHQLHKDIIDLFLAVSKPEEFWLDLVSPRLYSLLLHEGPYRKMEIDLESIFPMGQLFRNIIDFRSRFTSTHSSGVAECSASLARIFGLTDTEVGLMEIAGNLHDLGKLVVPNSILEKPDKLTREEFAVMRQHTYFTYAVLTTIGGLDQIAEWAAFHHEKLDGSGYPFHLEARRISTGSRIMAVADLFTALAEDRPYRKGMQRKEIAEILEKQVIHNFMDGKIVDLLLENYGEISVCVKEKQSLAREYFEKRFATSSIQADDGFSETCLP